MDRRKFIQQGCMTCLAITATAYLLPSCTPTRYIQGTLETDGLTVDTKEFIIKKGSSTAHQSFIIVRNDALQYPLCVYRLDEKNYSALWMSCTHQGAELQASGDRLQCSAHGSEFDNLGKVTNGPASANLRKFPVQLNGDKLFIDLRAV